MSNTLMLWRVCYGRISYRPVKCIDLGNGEIKVVGDCRISQKRDEVNESYHETLDAAMNRFLFDAQREVSNAERVLQRANRRLKNARRKWRNHTFSQPKDQQ